MDRRWWLAACLLWAGSALGAYHYTDEPDDTPYRAQIGTPPPCDYIIDSGAKWAQINSPSYRVFCVAPGDYTATAIPVLTADGTAQAPRWIRYYGPAADSTHPYHMLTGQQAIIKYLDFTGADYWVVDRITVNTGGFGNSRRAMFVNTSDHNVFSRLDVYGFQQGITFYNGSDYNTIQDSTIHHNTPGYDAGATEVFSWNYANGAQPFPPCQHNRVISNEIWDVGDGFQSVGDNGSAETYRGTVVFNNDMYLTTARYTDCNGTNTPTGLCARGENAIDIKSSSDSADEPMIIAHNRMWGFREAQSGTGMSDAGNALGAHLGNDHLRIEGNIIWDSATGLLLGYGFTDTVVAGNLIGPIPAVSNDGTWGPSTEGAVLALIGSDGVIWEDNVMSQLTGGSRRSVVLSGAALTGTAFAYRDNMHIDTAAAYPSTGTIAGTVSGNTYYASAVPAWDPTATSSATVPEEWVEWCTTIKRITAPTTQCFAKARYQTAGPPSPITTPSQFRILD